MSRTPEEIRALKEEIASVPSWYHVYDFGDGLRTPGFVDLVPYLEHYPLPERMEGMRVLDVGASNGFFSYEFERRGAAEVVSIDLPSWGAHDWTPRYKKRFEQYSEAEKQKFDDQMMRAGFELAGRVLGSKVVKKVEMPIYDLSPEALGTFDLVFSGSMLMHVRDPILGTHAMRSVCADDGAIVVSVSTPQEDVEGPLARFAGEWDQCNFWQFSPECMRRILLMCGFEPTGEETTYLQMDASNTKSDREFVCRAVATALE